MQFVNVTNDIQKWFSYVSVIADYLILPIVKMVLRYKLSNAFICNNDGCIPQYFVMVKNRSQALV